MKKIILFIALFGMTIISCSKGNLKDEVLEKENNRYQVLEKEVAERHFAAILSKALVNEECVRSFIKGEALKEFDRDYDVFYPYAKKQRVSEDCTLYDMMIKYSSGPEEMSLIERSLPKLTILVPDFSWINENCFSVHNWDTSSKQVFVSIDDSESSHMLFYDGARIEDIPAGCFPSFPVLIVKSNERVKVANMTKSGELTYSFVSDAFDGSLVETKAPWGYTEGDLQNTTYAVSQKRDLVSEYGNFVPRAELNGINANLIKAYIQFGTGWNGGVQRDYLYYGMSRDNQNHGVLNSQMRDMLYRISIRKDLLFSIADTENDPGNYLSTGRGDRPEFDEAISRIWGNGNFEIRMTFYQNVSDQGVGKFDEITMSIRPGDLMYIDKCRYTFQWNLFGNNWSTYTILRDEIQPKWYYPGDYGDVLYIENTWNLSERSDNVWVKITELDDTTVTSYEETQTFRNSLSVTASVTAGSNAVKGSLGVTGATEKSSTSKFTVTTTHGADELGSCFIDYTDNIITRGKTKNNVVGYELNKITTSMFDFSLLPIDKRNKAQIEDFLLNRRERNEE